MTVIKKGSRIPKVVNIQTAPPPEREWVPIDWDKVKNINDLKLIVSNMGLGCFVDSPNYEQLKKYLVPHEDRKTN